MTRNHYTVVTNVNGIENSNSKVTQNMALHMLMEIVTVIVKGLNQPQSSQMSMELRIVTVKLLSQILSLHMLIDVITIIAK